MRRGIAKDSDFKSSLWSQYEEETTGGARQGKNVGRPFRCCCSTPPELGPLGGQGDGEKLLNLRPSSKVNATGTGENQGTKTEVTVLVQLCMWWCQSLGQEKRSRTKFTAEE